MCYPGYTEMATMLCQKGADVHATDVHCQTALQWATKMRVSEVVKALLEKGADVHAEDSDGATVLPFYLR